MAHPHPCPRPPQRMSTAEKCRPRNAGRNGACVRPQFAGSAGPRSTLRSPAPRSGRHGRATGRRARILRVAGTHDLDTRPHFLQGASTACSYWAGRPSGLGRSCHGCGLYGLPAAINTAHTMRGQFFQFAISGIAATSPGSASSMLAFVPDLSCGLVRLHIAVAICMLLALMVF